MDRKDIDGGKSTAFAGKDIYEPAYPPVYGGTVDRDSGSKGKTVLIAEDNDSNYLLLYSVMKQHYTVIRAVNGVETVSLHTRLSPDLILMDIKMPVMDGLEATALIRKRDRSVPIIAVTAHAFAEELRAALEAGCDFVLTKPVDIPRLRELVAELIYG